MNQSKKLHLVCKTTENLYFVFLEDIFLCIGLKNIKEKYCLNEMIFKKKMAMYRPVIHFTCNNVGCILHSKYFKMFSFSFWCN